MRNSKGQFIKGHAYLLEWKEKNKNWHLGRNRTKETKEKISKNNARYWLEKHTPKGEKAFHWKGGKKEMMKRYYLKHKEKINFRISQRKKKKRSAGSHTLEEWNNMKKRYKYTCPACFKKEPEIILTEDHIVPIKKEGSNYIDNLQPLCRSCNSRKGIKIIKFRRLCL